ncbi:MAG: hypothetical protein WCD42_07440 [Rhizomicrobium sp.]
MANTPFPVALIRRFDRRGPARIPYISARTALGKKGAELGSYTEIVDYFAQLRRRPASRFSRIVLADSSRLRKTMRGR